jgi:hypothetical protein
LGFLLNSAMRSVRVCGALLYEGRGCATGDGMDVPLTVIAPLDTLGDWAAFCVRLGLVNTK